MLYVEVCWHQEIRIRSREVSYPLWLVWEDSWLSLVDPKLEVGANIKETNSYSSGPGHFVWCRGYCSPSWVGCYSQQLALLDWLLWIIGWLLRMVAPGCRSGCYFYTWTGCDTCIYSVSCKYWIPVGACGSWEAWSSQEKHHRGQQKWAGHSTKAC